MRSPELVLRPGEAIPAAAYTVVSGAIITQGATIDAKSFDWIEFRAQIGAATADTVTLLIQESDDGSTWSTVPGASTSWTNADANTVKSGLVRLATRKRYIRARTSTAGSNSTFAIFAITYTLIGPAYGSQQDYTYQFQVL